MLDYQNRLTTLLLEKNEQISYWQARIWIEILWNDIEMTYPTRTNDIYRVKTIEKSIRDWIEQYGDVLHEFVHNHPRYEHLFYINKKLLH